MTNQKGKTMANETATPEAPAAPSAEAPKVPKAGTVVTEIPGSSRQGFWATEFEWFKANPNVVKKYEDISPTTASYLRSTYGLDAHSRNTRGKRCDLYVTYNPDTAEAIKNRPVKHRKPKGEAAPAAPKGAGK